LFNLQRSYSPVQISESLFAGKKWDAAGKNAGLRSSSPRAEPAREMYARYSPRRKKNFRL